MIFCHGLTASHRATWRRTAASNRFWPSRVTRLRSPSAARSSATVSAACQVVDLNGCRAVPRHRRPGAFQQVPHLLHLRYLLGDQPGPADAQVP